MRDLLVLVILAGLAPVILFRPWTGVLTWFWIALMAPHRLGWGFMTTAPVAMGVGAITLLGLFLAKDRRALPLTREIVLIILFALYMTMTTYFAWSHTAWGHWDRVMKILLMTLITPVLIYGERRVVLLILVATFSIGFYGFKGGIFGIATAGQYMVLGPPGTFIGSNTEVGVAMIMALPLILISARMMSERWVELGWLSRWSKLIGLGMYATFWLTGFAILFTYSRGALLGLLAVGPFIFMKLRRKGLLVSLALVAVLGVGAAFPERLVERWQTIETYQEDRSAMQRIQAWGVNWNIAVENPIRGSGFNNAAISSGRWLSYANWVEPWANTARAAHSIYFQVLGHHGFGGLAIFLALIGFTFSTLNRIRRTARRETGQVWLAEFAWAIQVSLIGYLVVGAFLDLAYFNFMYALVAFAVIMRRELEETSRTAPVVGGRPDALTNSKGPKFPDFVASRQTAGSKITGRADSSGRAH